MSQYYTYANFLSCTPLVEFQATHKVNLEFLIPPTSIYKYDRIEVYRYIGDYMTCVDPNTITETLPHTIKVFEAKQVMAGVDSYGGQITTQSFFPNPASLVTLNINLTALNGFVDDFSVLTSAGTELRTKHLLTGVSDNSTVINDIGFTRRTLYYIIKTYIRGVADSAPYFLTPDYNLRQFVNHSSKNQVRHDYLQYEGDEVWAYYESGAASDLGAYGGLSRTAVDINRLYLDANQAGPTGRGGYCWVSDRSSGKAFQHNLKDGALIRSYAAGPVGRGFGIGIDINSGDCIAGPGDTAVGTSPILSRCKISDGSVTTLRTTWGAQKRCCYGIIPLYGYPDRMFVTDYFDTGYGAIVNIGDGSIYGYTTTKLNSYAACAGPNGKGIQAGTSTYSTTHGDISIVSPVTAASFQFDLNAGGINKSGGSRIAADSCNSYPNSITNIDGSRDYYTVHCNFEFGTRIPKNSTSAGDCSIMWASPTIPTFNGTIGYDGENNLWSAQYKAKLYRTAGKRIAADGITETNDDTVFPTGGNSRYPNEKLKDWPLAFTNTRDIEWFLTRNHGVSTINQPQSGSVVFDACTISEIDPPTLDNFIPVVNWDSTTHTHANNQTAYDAWWSLVDERMLRKRLVTHARNWSLCEYFKVFNPDTRSEDANGKKWGIRMKVDDIYNGLSTLDKATYKNSIDYFYEYGVSVWGPVISQRIADWSAAFAEDTSYSGGNPTAVQNNLLGIKVHPFYQYSTVATDGRAPYINPALTTAQKAQLTRYIDNLRGANLGHKIIKSLYMYSDFTGNILAGAIETSPLNRDVIYPDRTYPVLSLGVSGYQSNPGYQDTPARCYPWKNTLPVSMSAMSNGISGYDDFNVTYCLSANMGSFLLTSFGILTDDYYPKYFTDTVKLSSITYAKNPAYLTSGTYENKVYIDYTYFSPSVNGLWYLPSGNLDNNFNEYLNPANGKPLGSFIPSFNVTVKDLYKFSGATCVTVTSSTSAEVKVLERWPEPKFFLQSYDLPTVRKTKFCNSKWDYPSRYDKSSSLYRESLKNEALRYDTTYGVDPISGIILDRSIARTWPISEWDVTITTNNSALAWPGNQKKFTINQTSTALYVAQDEQNFFDSISGFDWRFGDYTITMNVMASTTSTSSDKPFVQYVKVSEFEPFANFWAIGAQTVSPNYSATNASILAQLHNINTVPNGVYVDSNNVQYPFVSGYAPNLTVYFKDSSEAHTFPISSYHWNFGDPYNEGPADITSLSSNYYTITNTAVLNGTFNNPCWVTNQQAHTAVHTFIMPGTYDVTLTVKASCTSTSDLCARYTQGTDTEKKFYVYVEEINPVCGNGIYASYNPTSGYLNTPNAVSSDSSFLTGYFMASGIIAGSFPICRIDWDFGDGTIQRITRRPLMTATDQGLPFVYLTAYAYDSADPRNYAVPHVYANNTLTDQTFDIQISAYACNTNTMLYCSAAQLVGPIVPFYNAPREETKKLIGSRVDDSGNLVYIFEGQNELTTHTIVLSGELT